MNKFDYQRRIWGSSRTILSPTYLAYLRLKYALDDIKGITGKLLDAGCGAGGFTKSIKYYRKDLDIYGIDISKEAVRLARVRYLDIKFSVGDLYNLPYQNNFFDIVIIEDVLEHLEKPEKALCEIKKVLKPNGVFHAFIPLEGSLLSLHFWFKKLGWKAKEKKAGHIQKFNLTSLTKLLRNQGFEIVKKRYSGHFFGQVIDIGHFTFIGRGEKEFKVGLEKQLEKKKFLKYIKDFITLIFNLESSLLSLLPGAGVHILCKKRN